MHANTTAAHTFVVDGMMVGDPRADQDDDEDHQHSANHHNEDGEAGDPPDITQARHER